MKKFINCFRSGLLLCAAALTFVACGDDEPTPTPKPTDDIATDIQGTHFDESNETLTVLDAKAGQLSVTYTLTRSQAAGDLNVGVKVNKATEGLILPEVVRFKDGSTTATYTVSAPDSVSEGSTFEFEVELKNADQFSATGATRFSATIAFPKKQYARMWFRGLTDEYGYFLNDVFNLGNGRIIFPNFMNSGTTVTMLTDASAEGQHEVDVITTPSLKADDVNYPGTGDYYLYCWEADPNDPEAAGTWTQFYPHGKDARVSIDYMTFYVSHDDYFATVYDPAEGTGWFQLSEVMFSDKSAESYWLFLNFAIIDSYENDGYDYSEPEKQEVDPNSLEAFVGTYTFTGSEPYCDNANLTPGTTYEVEIYIENDELRMNGLLGQAYDANGTLESYLLGKYDAANDKVTFGDAAGQYVWESNLQAWYFVYKLPLSVERNADGSVARLTTNDTWAFWGLTDDWLSASYTGMVFEKK